MQRVTTYWKGHRRVDLLDYSPGDEPLKLKGFRIEHDKLILNRGERIIKKTLEGWDSDGDFSTRTYQGDNCDRTPRYANPEPDPVQPVSD